MRTMTPKERLQATLAHERADRVCIFDLDSYGLKAQYAGVPMSELRWDPRASAVAAANYIGYTGFDICGIPDYYAVNKDAGQQINEPDNSYSSPATNFFETPEDVESKEIPFDIMNPKETPWMNKGVFDKITLTKQIVGEDQLIIGLHPVAFTLAGALRGVEQLLMDTLTEEDLADKMLAKSEALALGIQRRIMQAGADFTLFGDPTASEDLISHETFRRFEYEPTKRIASKIKSEFGVPIMSHICGDTSNICKYMAEMGIDMFSVDSKVDLAYYKGAIGEKVIVVGSVPTIDVLLNGTPEKVMESAQKCFERAAKGGNFILGPACEIPNSAPMENVLALRTAAERFSPQY